MMRYKKVICPVPVTRIEFKDRIPSFLLRIAVTGHVKCPLNLGVTLGGEGRIPFDMPFTSVYTTSCV